MATLVNRAKMASEWVGFVKRLPCVLCRLLGQRQESATEAHHIRDGQGTSQRSSDYLTIALCVNCHRSDIGLHGDKTLLRIAKVEELDLLALCIEAVYEQMLMERRL